MLSFVVGLSLVVCGADSPEAKPKASNGAKPVEVGGIYPSLAAFNKGGECGIGAVVPWADRLWFITYPPHARHGSDDKLYTVSPDKQLTIREESVGGTHANRLIHRESNQLFIGPYAIAADGTVRAIDVKNSFPGRWTATARHLTDPANKVYYYDMEGPVWEVDVHTLAVKKLFEKPVPGWHGKGAYSGQGRLVVANNGESSSIKDLDKKKIEGNLQAASPEDAGVLAEWDGKEWRIIERKQFTDVTGPGGVRGNAKETDPIWAMGWDKRSVILKLLDDGKWYTFRVPKGSYCFDPKHGWYTEWPRIREIGDGKFMMVMHGTMFDFPPTFSAANTAGLKPMATHLRYVPDFCNWNGDLVLAEDSTSIMQNPLAGQSQSNLWFGDQTQIQNWGEKEGWGGPWLGDAVTANEPSDPFLLSGYAQRMAHLTHSGSGPVKFAFEVDTDGKGNWQPAGETVVGETGYGYHIFPDSLAGEWIRVKTDKDCDAASCYFHYLPTKWHTGAEGEKIFQSVATISTPHRVNGIVRPSQKGGVLHYLVSGEEPALYEIDENLNFRKLDGAEQKIGVIQKLSKEHGPRIEEDAASILVTDAKSGDRFRLPKGNADASAGHGERAFREIMSERTLANVGGIFYEVPRGALSKEQLNLAGIKPVATHNKRIADFCSWRGLLVFSGTDSEATPDGHYFSAGNQQPGLWFGKADDLWKLGKPVGVGGPWKNSAVEAGVPSDPYLMTNFDKKKVELSHDAKEPVTFTIEVDFAGKGTWAPYEQITVEPGKTLTHDFPAGYGAHWVRVTSDKPAKATAMFTYE